MKYISKIKELVFYLLGFILACDIYAASLVIIAYLVCWIAEGNYKNKLSLFLRNKYALMFCAFYLLHLAGMLFTQNVSAGWFDLQVKLSILIFPIIFASEGELSFGRQKWFMGSFTAGLIVNGLICLAYATWRYFTQHVIIFEYMQFSVFLHPSYYSMYIDVALCWIFYMLTSKYAELEKAEKIFLFSAIVFLEFMLVLLQSKTGQIVSVFVIVVALVRYIVLKKRWLTGLVLLGGSIIIGGLAYYYVITTGGSRLSSAENILSSNKRDSTSTESTQVRYFVWHAAWQVIKEHPVLGVGTGYARDALAKQYEKDNYLGAFKERLNAHNEYLQVAVAQGVIGLLGLFACLILPLAKSIKEKRFVYVMFLIILMINFLTESMLETQGGTVFYGLFNSLLMFNFVI